MEWGKGRDRGDHSAEGVSDKNRWGRALWNYFLDECTDVPYLPAMKIRRCLCHKVKALPLPLPSR